MHVLAETHRAVLCAVLQYSFYVIWWIELPVIVRPDATVYRMYLIQHKITNYLSRNDWKSRMSRLIVLPFVHIFGVELGSVNTYSDCGLFYLECPCSPLNVVNLYWYQKQADSHYLFSHKHCLCIIVICLYGIGYVNLKAICQSYYWIYLENRILTWGGLGEIMPHVSSMLQVSKS